MSARRCLAIVLAAGEGTRMRSSRAKVLHAIGGRALIAHVLDAVKESAGATAVVIGEDKEKTRHAVADLTALYQVDGGIYRALPTLLFKKTVKIDLGGRPLFGPIGAAAARAVKGDIERSIERFEALYS